MSSGFKDFRPRVPRESSSPGDLAGAGEGNDQNVPDETPDPDTAREIEVFWKDSQDQDKDFRPEFLGGPSASEPDPKDSSARESVVSLSRTTTKAAGFSAAPRKSASAGKASGQPKGDESGTPTS